ncbi:MAG: hypothetical protein M4579_003621, partial [Chaenotheca gracillima]
MSSIDQLAQEWLRLDQDPDTRREIEHLRQAGATQELEKRLRNRQSSSRDPSRIFILQ